MSLCRVTNTVSFLVSGQFLEALEMFSRSGRRSKISNVMITELFYPHILNMNRGSLQTRSFGRIQNTVFRKINQK